MLNINKKFSLSNTVILGAVSGFCLITAPNANATIYKWRDAYGMTQYADNPPMSDKAVKISRAEIVNALQKKDYCAEDLTGKKTGIASAKNLALASNQSNNLLNANFSFANAASAPTTLQKTAAANTNNSSKSATTANNRNTKASPQNSASNSALGKTSNGVFGIGSFLVRAFATRIKPLKTPPKPPVTPPPVTPPKVTPPVVVPPVIPPVVTPPPVVPPVTPPVVTPPPVTPPPVTPPAPTSLMPMVDISKNVQPAVGSNVPMIGPTGPVAAGDGTGQFRTTCTVSHMSNDDPIIYPNQAGAAHHHTFWGNTGLNSKTNLATLADSGSSTCKGGTLNRSAYWVPSMIDTASNAPIKPSAVSFYYKTNFLVRKELVTAPPKGLRMIAGNARAVTTQRTDINTNPVFYNCQPASGIYVEISDAIPECVQGGKMTMHVSFPQCWDGKNLDSPDHKSHMAYPPNDGSGCPATHPVTIPAITYNVTYDITAPEGTANWRLSSDNYAKNGYNSGYSLHGDWVNGWDQNILQTFVSRCLNAGLDCGVGAIGDGRSVWATPTSEF
jgi:Domain of unknown function (DUF1996)/Domain of unknown function (DUF4124)